MMTRLSLVFDNNSVVDVSIRNWTKKNAVAKGMKASAIVLGATLLTIPIPLVHFISVPFGVLVTPLVGYLVFSLHNGSIDVTEGDFSCPHCGVGIDLKGKAIKPAGHVICGSCQHQHFYKVNDTLYP